MKSTFVCCSLLLISISLLSAQDNANEQNNNTSGPSSWGIQMIARTTQAVDYRKGATTAVDLKGTDLMPELVGKAKITNKRRLTDIRVDVDHLRPAKSLDLTYLTYVLWAISPEGHAKNIGELVPHDGKASLSTNTDLAAFALVISAEPDFAVAEPSEMVVAENTLRSTTQGRPESMDVHYQVIPRSVYNSQVTPIQSPVYGEDKKAPLDLLEARNAMRIARDAHADQYASDILNKAQALLDHAEDYYRRKQGSKPIATVAREAVQTAEEARVNSLRSAEQARVDRERKENEERASRAREEADQAKQQAQQAQQQAELAAQQRAAA